MTATAKVMYKGQVTIPKAVPEVMKLQSGDEVFFVDHGDRMYIERIPGKADPRPILMICSGLCIVWNGTDRRMRKRHVVNTTKAGLISTCRMSAKHDPKLA